jgi:hypothetical protein
MDANSKEGQLLTMTLAEAKIGKEVKIGMQSFAPRLSPERCQAILTSISDRLWCFTIYWFSLRVAEVSIERRKNEYIFEEL